MRMVSLRWLVLWLFMALPVFAVQPDEVLSDPVLEARARELSKVLRCPVCQGENIDESNAPVSRDLRLFLRERLVAGDSDERVIEAVTDRFGEFVLFEPRATGGNLILWLAGPLMLLVAAFIGWRFMRGLRAVEPAAPLSDAERARLEEIMRE